MGFVQNRLIHPIDKSEQHNRPITHVAEEVENDAAVDIERAFNATGLDTRLLINKLRASIPAYVDEFFAANIGDTSMQIPVSQTTNNLVRITALVVSTPVALTSVVVRLGHRTLPIVSGIVTLAPVSFVLKQNDIRSVVFNTGIAEPAWFWLMGEQLPESNW